MVFICEFCNKKRKDIFYSWKNGQYVCWVCLPKLDKYKHVGLRQMLDSWKQELKSRAKKRHEEDLSTSRPKQKK